MKYLKGILYVFFFTLLGEWLNVILPFSIPAGIYGLILFLTCLMLQWVKLEDVEAIGGFLLDTMPLMFIPAAVKVMESWDLILPVFVPLSLIILVSTVVVMGVSAKVAQWCLKEDKERKFDD